MSQADIEFQRPTGRFATRLARVYVNEGLALLGEGVAAARIERCAADAGMRIGPLALLDASSLEAADRALHASMGEDHDHAHGHGHGHDHHHHDHDHGRHHRGRDHHHEHDHVHAQHHEQAPAQIGGKSGHEADSTAAAGHGMTEDAIYVLEKMAHGFKRWGRAAGSGFYDYEAGEEPELWPGLSVFERRRVTIDDQDIRDRLLHVQWQEAYRCLQEGLVESTRVADDEAVRALYDGSSEGGPFARTRSLGLGQLARRASELAECYGERFALAGELLRRTHADTAPEDT